MELSVFQLLARCVGNLFREMPKIVANTPLDDVPAYPNACTIAMIDETVFRIKLVLSRRPGGRLETMFAIYDGDGDPYAMLLATDDEISELYHDCVAALAAVGIGLDGSDNN